MYGMQPMPMINYLRKSLRKKESNEYEEKKKWKKREPIEEINYRKMFYLQQSFKFIVNQLAYVGSSPYVSLCCLDYCASHNQTDPPLEQFKKKTLDGKLN